MDHEQDENRLTKQMAAFLRHKGLRTMQSDGYALVEDLAHLCHVDPPQILEVTQMPGKQRFQTMHDGQHLWIRATHGHTLKTVDVKGTLYQEVKAPLPILVHAVSGDSVMMVLAKGLNRGGRPHLLFTVSDEEDKLKQGFQDSCNILVYINMAKAMAAGIPFNWAPDGMVVSTGLPERKNGRARKLEKAGTIPADFILRVSNRNEKSTVSGLLAPEKPGRSEGYQNPSQDLLRMVTGKNQPPTPVLRPVLPGEPAEASAEAYEKLAQMQQKQMQLQHQQAHVRQMFEFTRLKEQHDQLMQVQQQMLQRQQQMAQRSAEKSLQDAAFQVADLSRQLEATQAALGGQGAYAPQSPEVGAFPPHLQQLFLSAQAAQGSPVPRYLQ